VTTELKLSEFIPTRTAPPALRSDDIHVRWVMPEIFYDLPIHEKDDDEAIRRLEELTDKALPGAGEDDKTRFGVICALGFDDLLAAGAEYAAICVTAVDETPCTATVYASLVDSPEAKGGVAGVVKEISSSLRRINAGEVSEIELPCGVAVSYIGSRESKVIGELTESGENLTFPTSYIRVYVPLPNGTTLVMELSTPTGAGWDAFSMMFGNTVSSIRLFTADGSPVITSGTGA
jgi:hypothetical protein